MELLRLAKDVFHRRYNPIEYPVTLLGGAVARDEAELDLFLLQTTLFTYRSGFRQFARSDCTSDKGWGCLIRTCQMMVARCLTLHGQLDLSWFRDVNDDTSPFSIHKFIRFVQNPNEAFDTKFWTPAQGCEGIRNTLIELGHMHILNRPLTSYVCADSTIVVEDVQFRLDDGMSVLVLLPTVTGLPRTITQGTYLCLEQLLQVPQSCGIVAGVPNRSYYLMGVSGQRFCFLDPHTTQPAFTDNNSLGQYCETAAALPAVAWQRIDSSVLLGFYIASHSDWDAFVDHLALVKKRSGVELFSVATKAMLKGGANARRPQSQHLYLRRKLGAPAPAPATSSSAPPSMRPSPTTPDADGDLSSAPRYGSSPATHSSPQRRLPPHHGHHRHSSDGHPAAASSPLGGSAVLRGSTNSNGGSQSDGGGCRGTRVGSISKYPRPPTLSTSAHEHAVVHRGSSSSASTTPTLGPHNNSNTYNNSLHGHCANEGYCGAGNSGSDNNGRECAVCEGEGGAFGSSLPEPHSNPRTPTSPLRGDLPTGSPLSTDGPNNTNDNSSNIDGATNGAPGGGNNNNSNNNTSSSAAASSAVATTPSSGDQTGTLVSHMNSMRGSKASGGGGDGGAAADSSIMAADADCGGATAASAADADGSSSAATDSKNEQFLIDGGAAKLSAASLLHVAMAGGRGDDEQGVEMQPDPLGASDNGYGGGVAGEEEGRIELRRSPSPADRRSDQLPHLGSGRRAQTSTRSTGGYSSWDDAGY